MHLVGHRLGCSNCKVRVRGRCTVARAAVRSTPKQQLLDSFWEARGVLDPIHRKRLVDAAEALEAEEVSPLSSSPLATDAPLPGLPATWQLEESTPEVLAASRRLLALQQMLGGGLGAGGAAGGGSLAGCEGGVSSGFFGGRAGSSNGGRSGGPIDVVWMVVREPGLLSADLAQLTGRLLEMKLATYGTEGVDVLKVIEAQPALLLSDCWRLDLESLQAAEPASASSSASAAAASAAAAEQHRQAVPWQSATPSGSAAESGFGPGAPAAVATGSPALPGPVAARVGDRAVSSSGRGDDGGAAGSANTVQQLVQAWQYGIASDGDPEWAARLSQLASYAALRGDTCVGFRDGDDPELSRWATKQRADRRRGELAPERLEQLTSLGFHFDADEAEWCRWFAELVHFKAATGHASPMPLVTGGDMYLINWCSVQRIARRSRVLSDSRIARLDELGFDWTGADPLS